MPQLPNAYLHALLLLVFVTLALPVGSSPAVCRHRTQTHFSRPFQTSSVATHKPEPSNNPHATLSLIGGHASSVHTDSIHLTASSDGISSNAPPPPLSAASSDAAAPSRPTQSLVEDNGLSAGSSPSANATASVDVGPPPVHSSPEQSSTSPDEAVSTSPTPSKPSSPKSTPTLTTPPSKAPTSLASSKASIAPTAVPESTDKSISASHAAVAASAIDALAPFFLATNYRWQGIDGWRAGNVYTDIVDYDYYSGGTRYKAKYGTALTAISVPNSAAQGQVWIYDGYIDDQLWWCLAMLRAFQTYGYTESLAEAKRLWQLIASKYQISATPSNYGTCNLNGAVFWNTAQAQVNAISTSLFVQVGARLMELDKGSVGVYQGPTLRALTWVRTNMLRSDGIMDFDSIKPGSGCTKNPGTLTYNTGVYIGALTALYRATGNTQYAAWLTTSVTSATSGTFGNSPPLVVHEEHDRITNGDGDQWRDGLFRNLLDYYVSIGHKDPAMTSRIEAFVQANYDNIQSKARYGSLYSVNWFGLLPSGSDWGTGSVLSVLNCAMVILK